MMYASGYPTKRQINVAITDNSRERVNIGIYSESDEMFSKVKAPSESVNA